jgi:hypothetical protein
MRLELSPEQQKAVDAAGGEPVPVVDPRTRRTFVIVPAESCLRTRPSLTEVEDAGVSQINPTIPEGLQRSKQAFFRAHPALLKQKKRRGQGAVYHGEKRLGFGATETELYQKCFRRGLKAEEFYVGWIGPQPPEPEEIDRSFFEFEDCPPTLDPAPKACHKS